MSLLIMFLPLIIVICLSAIVWHYTNTTNEKLLLTTIKIFCYRHLYWFAPLMGISFFLYTFADRYYKCIEEYKIIFQALATIAGLLAVIILVLGMLFKENESKEIIDEQDGALRVSSNENNTSWSPSVIYKLSISSFAFSMTYIGKITNAVLNQKLYLDILLNYENIIFWLFWLAITCLIVGSVAYHKILTKYKNELKRGEVFAISLTTSLIVFPYSILIAYFDNIVQVMACVLNTKLMQ